jgi:hypothetical protein
MSEPRKLDDPPALVIGGVRAAIILVLIGARAAGLAVLAVAVSGLVLWRYWPLPRSAGPLDAAEGRRHVAGQERGSISDRTSGRKEGHNGRRPVPAGPVTAPRRERDVHRQCRSRPERPGRSDRPASRQPSSG